MCNSAIKGEGYLLSWNKKDLYSFLKTHSRLTLREYSFYW